MPTVPYSPVPTASPQPLGTPKLGVNTPIAAFGGTVAQALEGLGKQVEHSGDEIFRRAVALQDLKNETDAKEADAQYMMKVGELHANFSSLQGKAAAEAYPKYMEDIQKLRVDMRGALPNDAARRMYDSSSLSTMGRTIFNGAGHAATQMKVSAHNASSARVDSMLNNILMNPQDDVSFKRLTRGIEGEVRSQAELGGWDGAQTEDQITKKVSAAWAHRIIGLAKTAPFQADEMLKENRAKLHWEDIERVENTVRSQTHNAGARNISDEVNKDLYGPEDPKRPERSLQDRIQEAEAKAKKLRPDDPIFADLVRERTRADFNKHKSEIRDFNERNVQTVAGALNGTYGGKVPTTVEELTATHPKVAAAYDSLDETKKLAIARTLARNAKGDVYESPETIRRRQELIGLRNNDPVKFLEMDMSSENLPLRQRRELGDMQSKLKEKAETDPRVNHALSILRPNLLDPIGLTHSKDETGYNRFVGALQDALNQYQEEAKKIPDYKKTLEIGQRLLQDQNLGWWQAKGLFSASNKLYDLEVPEKAAAAIKADPAWATKGIEPTQEMIQRIYVGARYQELYGGKDKSAKEQGKPK